jgi:hypothetical protein
MIIGLCLKGSVFYYNGKHEITATSEHRVYLGIWREKCLK